MPPGRILVVEDEAIIAVDLKSRLNNMGYQVVGVASSGEEAVARAGDLRPDLILMDIVLKGHMDGAEAGERIRLQHDIPIIYLTAYSDDRTLQRVKQAEPYGYILKPFQDREMYTTIEIALHKHGVEKRLHDSEARLRTLFGAAHDLIFVKDLDLRYTQVNAAMSLALGRPAEALVGLTDRDLLSEAQAAALEADDCRVLAGETTEREHVLEIAGRPATLHVVKAPMRDDATGAIIGLCGIARDITARTQAEESLRRQFAMQNLISSIARRFIDVSLGNVDAELRRAVKDIGEFAGVDRSFLNLLDDTGGLVTRVYEWRIDGLEPMADVVAGMSIQPMAWAASRLRSLQVVNVRDVAQLPDSARFEREFWQSCGVRAVLTIPLVLEGAMIGMLGFTLNIESSRPTWQDEDVRLLTLMAEILTVSLARVRAEQALRASEERYRLLVNSTDDFIYSFDLDTRYTGANESLCRTLGLPEQAIIGKRPSELGLSAADEADWRQLHRRVIDTGSMLRAEIKVAMPGGPVRISDLVLNPLLDASRAVYGLVGVSRDITEQKRAHESLRESQRLFREVLENVELVAVMLDTRGCITFVNDFTCDLTGWRREELLGRNWFDVLTPGNEAPRRAFAEGIARGGPQAHAENTIITRRRQARLISWNNTPLLDADGNVAGVTSIGEDVTDRRRAESIQSALYRISEQSALAENVQALYPLIHRIVGDLINAQSLYIAVREGSHHLDFPYLADPFLAPEAAANFPGGELRRELAEYVLCSGMPMLATPEILGAVCEQAGAMVAGPMPVNWLGVPLRLEGRIYGVLAVQSYSPEISFGETEKSILNFVSQHVASAIARKRSEEALRASEERFRAIFENSALGVFQSTAEGRLLIANQAFAHMLGYSSPDEAVQSLTDLASMIYVNPDQRQHFVESARSKAEVIRYETEFRRRDGSIFTGDVHMRVVRDDSQHELYMEGFIEDITDRKRAESRLRYLYAHDILTGLHNRAYFEEELARLSESRRFPVGVIIADVDQFKRYNDQMGHAGGDEVLRQVARLIKDAFRAEDVVARLGGDEFAVLLPESTDATTSAAVARMRERLAEHNHQNDRVQIQLSIGFATAEKRFPILDALREADARMYREKALHGLDSLHDTKA